jgi:hypothetical protein
LIGTGYIDNARIAYAAVDTLRVAGNAVTTMSIASSGGGYTSGAIWLPNGAQNLFILAIAGVSEGTGVHPVSANFQLKFNGGVITDGGNYTHPGWGEAIVQSCPVGGVGPGYYGFEGIVYNGGGGGTLTVYGIDVFCIALMR